MLLPRLYLRILPEGADVRRHSLAFFNANELPAVAEGLRLVLHADQAIVDTVLAGASRQLALVLSGR